MSAGWEDGFTHALRLHPDDLFADAVEHYAKSPPGFTDAEKAKWRRKRELVALEQERRNRRKKK